MKKKILISLIMMMVAVSTMSGCELKDKLSGDTEKKVEDQKDSDKNTDIVIDLNDEVQDDNKENNKQKASAYFFNNYLGGTFFVSEDGSIADFVSLDLDNLYVFSCSDKEAFGISYNENGESEIYCYEYESGDRYIIDTHDAYNAQYYNGKVYVTKANFYYDEELCKSSQTYDEYIYEKNAQGKYELVETKLDIMNNDDIESVAFFNGFSFNGRESIDCSFEKYGNVVVNLSNNKGYELVDANGDSTKLELESADSLVARTMDYIIYKGFIVSEEDPDVCDEERVFVYNTKTGENREILDDYYGELIADNTNNIIYYAKDVSKEFNVKEFALYAMDLDDDKEYLIGKYDTPAGYDVECGVTGLSVVDGRVYFADVNDDKTVTLHMAEKVGDEWKDIDTGYRLTAYENDFDEYGEIKYLTNTNVCDKCGEIIDQYYEEYFVLDDRFEHADVINKYLYDKAKVGYDHSLETVMFEAEADDCEYHSSFSYPIPYESTCVRRIEPIGNHYLQIYENSDWYGGGAHGMPSQDYMLFDLSTGEIVSLGDLYAGTQEELDEIVYQKTLEKYKDEPEYFFEYTEDELYENACGKFLLTDTNVEYTEDAIVLYYMPYDMGPFASGFIDIAIPYDELDIHAFQN